MSRRRDDKQTAAGAPKARKTLSRVIPSMSDRSRIPADVRWPVSCRIRSSCVSLGSVLMGVVTRTQSEVACQQKEQGGNASALLAIAPARSQLA